MSDGSPRDVPVHAWDDLVGDFAFQLEDARGYVFFRSTLRLQLVEGPSPIAGTEEYPDRKGGLIRQPVTLEGNEIVIGHLESEDMRGRYRIDERSPSGFRGTFRIPQPRWLQEQQPGTPESMVGTYSALRDAAAPTVPRKFTPADISLRLTGAEAARLRPTVDRAALERLLASLPPERRPMAILHFSREVSLPALTAAVRADPELARHHDIECWLDAMVRHLDAVASRRAAGTAGPEDAWPFLIDPSGDPSDDLSHDREIQRLWQAVEQLNSNPESDAPTD